MATSFLVSTDVINTIQSLPTDDQMQLATALAAEMFLGRNPRVLLSAQQMIVYTFIKFSIDQDTRRRHASDRAN